MEIIPMDKEEAKLVKPLAAKIWNENYIGMISQKQIQYMLDWMYNEDKIQGEIINNETWFWIRQSDQNVGYLQFYPKDGKIFLSKIYLDTAVQGKGMASIAMDFVVENARTKQLPEIELTVNKNNDRAIAFYEKYGFQRVDEKVFDIGNGFVMDDFIYRLEV